MFSSRFYPKDGDLIQVNIRSQGDETTFKPIRIDFTVVDCKPIGGGGGESPNEFKVFGRMYVPNLFTESVEYEEEVTSFDALLNIAEIIANRCEELFRFRPNIIFSNRNQRHKLCL